jgi:hypothetical protein
LQLRVVKRESNTSREDWSRVIPRSTVSVWIMKVLYGSKTSLWYQKTTSCEIRFLMRLILPNIPFTPVARRCIMI